jgi:hypothetical protein
MFAINKFKEKDFTINNSDYLTRFKGGITNKIIKELEE